MFRSGQLQSKSATHPRGQRRRRWVAGLFLLLTSVLFVQPVCAQNNPDGGGGDREISAAQAAQIAQNQYGGKVLKITRNGNVYVVRLLLESGMLINVPVSAVSN